MSEEFTDNQTIDAIKAFLELGEETYHPDCGKVKGQGGYFSGNGWAARCLRQHLADLKKKQEQANGETKVS